MLIIKWRVLRISVEKMTNAYVYHVFKSGFNVWDFKSVFRSVTQLIAKTVHFTTTTKRGLCCCLLLYHILYFQLR